MSASPYQDLDRPPLSEASLRRGLTGAGAFYTDVRVLAETGSTNADVARAARAGAAEGLVLVAEGQSAGRGRLDRVWVTPPRSALAVSVLLRPDEVPLTRWSWLPLLAGVAAATALGRLACLPVKLKWPNDLIVLDPDDPRGRPPRKLGGILVERAGDAAVVGIGVNVSARAAELPIPTATSLAMLGAAVTDRDPLLRALLRELAEGYQRWRAVAADRDDERLRAEYRRLCATLGREVRVELPGDDDVTGLAVDVDAAGRLAVRTPWGSRVVSAGDVAHVR